MIRQLINFFRAYIKGDEAELHLTAEFTWWEVGAIIVIAGLFIYLLCR